MCMCMCMCMGMCMIEVANRGQPLFGKNIAWATCGRKSLCYGVDNPPSLSLPSVCQGALT
jgi:hypothetical protein